MRGGGGRKCNAKVEKKGTVGVAEDMSEHGDKSRALEVSNGSTNVRKRMSELAGHWERGSSSKCPRAGETKRQPRGAGGASKSSRRSMPDKKPRQQKVWKTLTLMMLGMNDIDTPQKGRLVKI